MQMLYDDGFRYIVLHKIVPQSSTRVETPADWILALFADFVPMYEDSEVTIYTIADLSIPYSG
jgi:hypothetical protein